MQTTLLAGEGTTAESITRSRFSQRIVDAGEVVLTVELSVESVSVEIPSADIPPSEVQGYPRVGILRMERNGRVLEMPADMPVGRGLVFPQDEYGDGIKPGDTWTVTEPLEGGAAVVEHTFVGWDDSMGRDCALFFSRSLQYEGKSGEALLDGNLEGETLFDADAGVVVRSLLSVTTRIRSGDDSQITQASSQVDLIPRETILEARV